LLSLTSGHGDAREAKPWLLLRAEGLAKWQLDHLTTAASPSLADDPSDPRGWERGVFWVGMTALADASSEPWIRGAVPAQGRANQWTLGSRLYHADDQVIGQTYLWAAEHSAGGEAIAPLRSNLDRILADPPRVHLAFVSPGQSDSNECLKRWCWSDALFMAPATWLGLSRQTGDRRYRDFALSEFWATTNFLYDPSERLYFRDSRFFELREADGPKVFWSRGNGWVFAGMARMMEALPLNDPDRRRFRPCSRRWPDA
jgi:rhamnogalacturonyl hydrolase YesR